MKPWTLPLTALVAALISAGIVIGVMAWEPWEANEDFSTDLPSRLASCDSTIHSSEEVLRRRCYSTASTNLVQWQCYVTWGDTFDKSRDACLIEAMEQPRVTPR